MPARCFIEALQTAGVKVDAAPVTANPVDLLPPKNSCPQNTKIVELTGLPYPADAKLVLKVSYNIGADTSLLLYGRTQGVDNMVDALVAERQNLIVDFPFFQRLALPISHGSAKDPGIKLHDTRILRLMEVLLHGGTRVLG